MLAYTFRRPPYSSNTKRPREHTLQLTPTTYQSMEIVSKERHALKFWRRTQVVNACVSSHWRRCYETFVFIISSMTSTNAFH